ncbi:unnamed protein product [Adineta steineri]|uniref:G-protein coupled receptors family 1 profile domain-containing protein n=1 Tax=Adineta steineri TaxID=433720 RepID=A0A820C5V0_9BILA|nr:unnamed protein product [Adineta steineri]CAF3765120.1 unnamed protein product [Adineta steineri]CAF4210980.1 unnamed protein product [Adineta steineri]
MFWWAIPLELLILAFSFIGLISSIVFILVVVIHREFRQNLILLLTINLSIGGLITCVSMISQALYMIMQSEQDRLCPFRSYFYTAGGLYIFQAALLQTLHRLFITVFAHRRYWQNRCLFLSLALAQLLLCLLALLPLLLGNRFPYFPSAKACYIALNDIFGVLYPAICFYFIPLILQSGLSYWILQHVARETRAGRAGMNIHKRINKERRVLARVALPVILLLSVGLIFFVFFFGTILTNTQWEAPPYALHLSFLGSSAATGASMMANLFLYREVKKNIWLYLRCLWIHHEQNRIHILGHA